MNDITNFLLLPASLVVEKGEAILAEYRGGMRERLRDTLTARQREEYRQEHTGSKTGWFWWKRDLTPAEVDMKIDRDMKDDEWGFGGDYFVRISLSRYDAKANQIADLVRAAKSVAAAEMIVDTDLWRFIVSDIASPRTLEF